MWADEDSNPLTEGTDYTVSYTNHVNAGTATVTIIGTGNYTGTIEEKFVIDKAANTLTASISASSITIGETATITASCDGVLSYSSDHTDVATVQATVDSQPESGAASLTVTGIAAGSAVISVTAAGDDNHEAGTAELTVTVSQLDLSGYTMTLSAYSYTYDGTAKQPAVTVTNGTVTLTQGNDYLVSYSDNVNVGTATVSVSGTGSYTGTVSGKFVIDKAENTLTAAAAATSIPIGETTTITASGTGTLTCASDNTSIAAVRIDSTSGTDTKTAVITVTGVAAGTAVITVTAAGDTNYKEAICTISITVSAAGTGTASDTESNTNSGTESDTNSNTNSNTNSGTESDTNSSTGADTNSGTDSSTNSGSGSSTDGSAASSADSNTDSTANSGTDALGVCSISALTNETKGITIEWNEVTGASGYTIYRGTSSGKLTQIAGISGGSTASYTDTDVKSKNRTTYIYKVTANAGGVESEGTEKTTVRLTAPKLSSVKNTASKKATVKWKKVSKVNGYQIQYSTSKTFAKSVKTKKVSGASKKSLKLSSLKKGKTYYVRIRTYKKVNGTIYYGAWSTTKRVKIKK